MDVDFGARTFSFFVDGQSLGTFDFVAVPDPENPGVTYTNTLRRGTMLTYAAPDTNSLEKGDYAAHFDRFSIQAVSGSNGDDSGLEISTPLHFR